VITNSTKLFVFLGSILLWRFAVSSENFDFTERQINWDAATVASIDIENAFLPLPLPLGSYPEIPLIIPGLIIDSDEAVEEQHLDLINIFLFDGGYTLLAVTDKYQVTIDASRFTFRGTNSADIPENYESAVSVTSEQSMIVTVGRYGAMYIIELSCRSLRTSICVTESDVKNVINSLITYPRI